MFTFKCGLAYPEGWSHIVSLKFLFGFTPAVTQFLTQDKERSISNLSYHPLVFTPSSVSIFKLGSEDCDDGASPGSNVMVGDTSNLISIYHPRYSQLLLSTFTRFTEWNTKMDKIIFKKLLTFL